MWWPLIPTSQTATQDFLWLPKTIWSPRQCSRRMSQPRRRLFPASASASKSGWLQLLACYASLTLLICFSAPLLLRWQHLKTVEQPTQTYQTAPILVSYAFFQKDAQQIANLDYFLTGWSQGNSEGRGGAACSLRVCFCPLAAGMQTSSQDIHWVIVSSTEACGPCKRLPHHLKSVRMQTRVVPWTASLQLLLQLGFHPHRRSLL
jgi:hypothetical protein